MYMGAAGDADSSGPAPDEQPRDEGVIDAELDETTDR